MSRITHRFVETNGIRMYLAEQGEGPLVVLCHGFPESWYSWRHQIPALADAGFHVVAPDERGYGQTDRPEPIEKYSMLHLTGDIVGLLDALGEETAVIVGHDWGAPLAWNCALMRPDRFRAVVGMSVPYLPRGPVSMTVALRQAAGENFYILYFQEPGKAERQLERDVRDTMRRILYAASGDATQADRWRPVVPTGGGLLDAMGAPSKLPRWLTQADLDFYTSVTWELTAAYTGAKVTQAAMFIAGREDAVLGFPGMDMILASFPHTLPNLRRSLIIEGAGHWIQQERPDQVNAALIEFLRAL
ncbi:MAG: epoxide hydrolase [Acidobacteria bacterium]|nr:MAG: epoxide hydrolase [Acidobacteriota bacterium]